MNKKNGSDLHLTVGSPVCIRINGEINLINDEKLSSDNIKELFTPYLSENQLSKLAQGDDLDFTIGIEGLSRFRVNVFMQRGNIVSSIRFWSSCQTLTIIVPDSTKNPFHLNLCSCSEHLKFVDGVVIYAI